MTIYFGYKCKVTSPAPSKKPLPATAGGASFVFLFPGPGVRRRAVNRPGYQHRSGAAGLPWPQVPGDVSEPGNKTTKHKPSHSIHGKWYSYLLIYHKKSTIHVGKYIIHMDAIKHGSKHHGAEVVFNESNKSFCAKITWGLGGNACNEASFWTKGYPRNLQQDPLNGPLNLSI